MWNQLSVSENASVFLWQSVFHTVELQDTNMRNLPYNECEIVNSGRIPVKEPFVVEVDGWWTVVLKPGNGWIIVEDRIPSLLHWLPNSYLHGCAHLHAGGAAKNVFGTITAYGMNAKTSSLYNISKNLKVLFYVREVKYF